MEPDLFDEGIVVESVLVGDTYVGAEAGERWMREIDEQFEQWEVSVDDFELIAADRVLAHGRIHLRGRESGLELDQPCAYLLDFTDGRMSRMRTFTSLEEARAAAR